MTPLNPTIVTPHKNCFDSLAIEDDNDTSVYIPSVNNEQTKEDQELIKIQNVCRKKWIKELHRRQYELDQEMWQQRKHRWRQRGEAREVDYPPLTPAKREVSKISQELGKLHNKILDETKKYSVLNHRITPPANQKRLR